MSVRSIVESSGMRLLSQRAYLRRVPGRPVNQRWLHLQITCPCGRAKHLHLRRESLPQLADDLRDHLVRDGLA